MSLALVANHWNMLPLTLNLVEYERGPSQRVQQLAYEGLRCILGTLSGFHGLKLSLQQLESLLVRSHFFKDFVVT